MDTESFGRQIAALPMRRRKGHVEILLITSRETKRWLIPKGWPMDGIADHKAAKIEAFEEAGIDGRIGKTPIGFFEYEKRGHMGDGRPLLVTVYALQVSELKRNWPEKSERQRKWFSAAMAAELVKEEGLRGIIGGM